MMNRLHSAARVCRRLPVLAGLATLALLASMLPAVAATANPVASPASSGSRCSVAYLRSELHLARVTVDSLYSATFCSS